MLGYYLQVNSGYGTQFTDQLYTVLANELQQYTFGNLIAGATYQFRIAAFNLLEAANPQFDDQLNFSDSVSFVIANAPEAITDLHQAAVGYEVGKIKLVWSEPESNGSQITAYLVTRDVGSGVFF